MCRCIIRGQKFNFYQKSILRGHIFIYVDKFSVGRRFVLPTKIVLIESIDANDKNGVNIQYIM